MTTMDPQDTGLALAGPLADRLATWWALPPRVGGSTATVHTRPTAAEVSARLTDELGEASLRAQFTRLLIDVVHAVASERRMSAKELDVLNAVFALATTPTGPEVPGEVVRLAARGIPPALAYFAIGRMIDRFLTRGELAATLLDAIQHPASSTQLADALTGVQLYQHCGRADPTPEVTAPVVDEMARQIAQLEQSPDAEIARLAARARPALSAYLPR